MIAIEILMAYCRADGEDAQQLVEDAAQDAENFLDALGADPAHPLYNKALKALTLHFFDNPEGGDLSPALKKMLNTLKT